MAPPLEPARALDPGTLTSLYLGALGLSDDDRRLAAAETVLCLGRLGLRPEELLHCHAGWIDWEHGELQVPDHEDCACELCWERARVAQRDGDGRALADIVAEDAWSGTPRAIPFGWAGRLTGVLATAVDAWDYLDYSAEALRGLLVESAERAPGVDPDAVDFGALRASAAAFFADAGFDAPRVADVMGIDVETAAGFTAQQPGRARTHLYEAFDAEPPATAGAGETYPLLTDPTAHDNEPFDPTTFDAAWRAERASEADDPESSPRPAATVEEGDPEQPDDDQPTDDDTSEAAEEDESADDTVEGESTPSESEAAAEEPESLSALLHGPVVLEVHTRFAGSGFLNGRPAGGRVLFGERSFVVGAHGGGELQATAVVPYAAVRDVAVEWAPDRLAEVFEETVGIAVEREDGRQTLVIELPPGERETLVRTLFEGLLGERGAVVRHPATVGHQVTDVEPVRRRVAAVDGRLEVRDDDGADPAIALADVVGVDRESLTVDGAVHHGVLVEHVRRDGRQVGTLLAPVDDRARRLLERYVRADLDYREQRAADADLSSDEHDVLDALETNPGKRNLAKLLDMDRDRLTTVLDSLADAGFVHAAEDGVRISGLGRLRLGKTAADVGA